MSEINSIIEIRRIRDEIREKINSRDKNMFLDSKFGSENEYTFNGLIGGISALLTDISALTKAPNRFIKLSTYNERQSILQYLGHINSYFNDPHSYISYFESLKSLIRSFNLRFSNERQIEFEKEIDNLLRLKIEFEDKLIEARSLSEEISSEKNKVKEIQEETIKNLESLKEYITKIEEKSEKFNEDFESFEELTSELETIKTKSKTLLEEIIESHNNSASNEKVIENFANKIESSEKKVNTLNLNVQENEDKLKSYEEERKNLLNEANDLINSAKEALNYKTAEGISASFQTQYDNSITFWNKNLWLVLASVCLLITIGIGIWIIDGNQKELDLNIIITRITLLPFPIFGAIFCANQYTKQKNISEDYAYKMVIAKSIVGFSEQLKKHSSEDKSEYLHYIKTALEEIHKDPLRNRKSKSEKSDFGEQKIKDIIEIAQKLKNISN